MNSNQNEFFSEEEVSYTQSKFSKISRFFYGLIIVLSLSALKGFRLTQTLNNALNRTTSTSVTQTKQNQINIKLRDNIVEYISSLSQLIQDTFSDQKSFNESDDTDKPYNIGEKAIEEELIFDPYDQKISVMSFGSAEKSPGFVITIPNVPYDDCIYFTQKVNWSGAINSKAYPNYISKVNHCTKSANTVSVFYSKN